MAGLQAVCIGGEGVSVRSASNDELIRYIDQLKLRVSKLEQEKDVLIFALDELRKSKEVKQ